MATISKNYNTIGWEELRKQLFYLYGSNHLFMAVMEEGSKTDFLLDMETFTLYKTIDVVNQMYPFYFYLDEDDEDYLGIEIEL